MKKSEAALDGSFNHKDMFTVLDLSVRRLKEDLKVMSTRKPVDFKIEGQGAGNRLSITYEVNEQ